MKKIALLLIVLLFAGSSVDSQNRPTVKTSESKWKLKSVLSGHLESIHSVAFSPDGTLVASASWDKSVIVWDAQTGEKKFVLRHGYHPHKVIFSPDNQFLYSSGGNGVIKKWNMQTGDGNTIMSDRPEIMNLTISADGNLLACDCRNKTAEILDARTGALKMSLPHNDYVNGLSLSPNGKLLAVAGSRKKESSVDLWNAQTGHLIRTLPGVDYTEKTVFSPDGKILALSSQTDANIKLYNPLTGKLLQTLTRDNYGYEQVVFSPNNRWLAVLTNSLRDGICFYDLQENKWLDQTISTNSTISEFAFSADSKMIVTGGYDDLTVKIWANPDF